MKPYSQCSVLIPCHSLEDFPTHHLGTDAESLLASWTAIWHPALIAASGKPPGWLRAGIDEIESPDMLLVVPTVAQYAIDDSFRDLVKERNAVLIGNFVGSKGSEIGNDEEEKSSAGAPLTRDRILQIAFANNAVSEAANQQIDPEIAADFLALGYAYLQIQLMTRQLRYSSNLNQATFDERVVAAAISAAASKSELAKQDLIACFDLLMEEKNSYYPVQPELVDLVLVAETTLKKSLTRQLTAVQHPLNLLLTGDLMTQLDERNPEASALIKDHLKNKSVSVIGGLQQELPDPLVSTESVVRQLIKDRQTRFDLLNTSPATVFFRRRAGLTPALPGLLGQFDFVGAIHATLDDGKFPLSSSSNIRWTGSDCETIPAFGHRPLAADDAAVLLRLGLSIGEQIDSAHTATLIFAHWPGRTCESFEDLVRVARYGNLFGYFIRLEEYFDAVYDPGFGDTYEADDYGVPYLRQSLQGRQQNPTSRFVDYWIGHYRLIACRSLLTQIAIMTRSANQEAHIQLLKEIECLESEFDKQLESENNDLREQTLDEIDALQTRIAENWPLEAANSNSPEEPTYRCLINTTNAKRNVMCSTPNVGSIVRRRKGSVVVADTGLQETDWIVELGSTAHTRIDVRKFESNDPLKKDPAVLDDRRLQNEFFELQVDENTGGIRSIQLHGSRENLIGQQIAMRIPTKNSAGHPLTRARYTTMVVDQTTFNASSRIAGSITTHGHLNDGEQAVAHFKQTVKLARGIPIAELEIEIDLLTELESNINHYVCSRLAWRDESSRVVSNCQETRQFIATDWFQATNFIELEQGDHLLTLLTGGLPYHRRASRRMIDSVLIVGGETRRNFRMGLGVDLPYPSMAAAQWMTPAIQLGANQQSSRWSESPAGTGVERPMDDWLFHFDCKNILVTWWQPVFDSAACLTGVQLRMKETEGRAGKLSITMSQPIRAASRVSLVGDFLRKLDRNDAQPNAASVEFSGNEFFQVFIEFPQTISNPTL